MWRIITPRQVRFFRFNATLWCVLLLSASLILCHLFFLFNVLSIRGGMFHVIGWFFFVCNFIAWNYIAMNWIKYVIFWYHVNMKSRFVENLRSRKIVSNIWVLGQISLGFIRKLCHTFGDWIIYDSPNTRNFFIRKICVKKVVF